MNIHLVEHPDGLRRCSWCSQGPAFADYIHYHDTEWGVPEGDEQKIFETMILEGFQAGLSWLTVLRKREHMRKVFADFNPAHLAKFNQDDLNRLANDPGIIRHRGKIQNAVNNAQQLLKLWDTQGKGSLARLVWQHEPDPDSRPSRMTPEVASKLTYSRESASLSKALRKLGFGFVGPTTMYAMMQSLGVVNDHLDGCFRQAACEALRMNFKRP